MSKQRDTSSSNINDAQKPTVIIANMDETDWETLLLEMRLVEM